MTPAPRAVPFVWKWSTLYPLAQRAGDLVPVGRGGERRAIALANPGLGGAPYVTPTLWAAIQYLGPRETAPEHRHSQNAFRFVVEGEGVWTVVNGDPVAMRRGDFLLTPGLALPRPPQRNRSADGVDRRAGHPVRALHRHRLLRVRLRRRHRRIHSACLAVGAAVGASRPASAGRPGRQEQFAHRGLPLGAHRRRAARATRARRRGVRGDDRTRPRRGPLHQPDHRR